MATLQKIRNRGGLLISILIGLALLAFVASDALSSGSTFFGDSLNKAGEIAGQNINIIDYQKEIQKNEETIKMMYGTALNEQQQAEVRESTWQEMIRNIVMNQEYEALGIDVSGDELYDMLLGENMNPSVRQSFGSATPEQIREYVTYLIGLPSGDPQKAYWLNLEAEISSSRKMNKYNSLLNKGIFITDAEAESSAKDNAVKTDISYIVKNYSSVSDSTLKISDNEIKNYYKANPALFQQEESRQIAYVTFDVLPSSEDYTETRKWINELIPELQSTENPAEFVDLTSDVRFDSYYYKKEEILNDTLADFLFKDEKGVYGPYIENDAYKISRVASVKMLPDSVRARHILIPAANNDYATAIATADSLAELLRKGADFESFARQFSTDEGSAVNGGDLGWFGPKTMVQPFSDTVFFAKVNDIKVVATQYGVHIVQVRNRAKLEKKIQIATVVKDILPSQATINRIYAQVSAFAGNINTLDEFNTKVDESGVIKRIATVRKNDRTIAGMEDVRELVRHTYMAKNLNEVILKENKSNIFDSEDRFIVAVLTDIKEEGIAPVESVASSIRTELLNRKKAEILTRDMAAAMEGSQSLLSVAQKLNLEVKDANNVSFGDRTLSGFEEPAIIATATMMETGNISQPIAGNQGVYIIMINDKAAEEVTPEMVDNSKMMKQQMNMFYNMQYGTGIQALLKNAEIKDLRYKFY